MAEWPADVLEGDNLCWEGLTGIEPWEPDDDYEPEPAGLCAYCGALEVRERPEPFGGQLCCERCFNVLIGGEEDDPPFQCSRDLSRVAAKDTTPRVVPDSAT